MKKQFIYLLLICILVSCTKEKIGVSDIRPEKNIVTFALDDIVPFVNASIDQNSKLITATVPYGTNLKTLKPTITVSDHATLSPSSGTIQDFSAPVVYTVTAKDGSTSRYTVKITITKKYLDLFKVVNSWVGYNENSWERQHPVYETNDMQIFMVILWNIAMPKVSVYKFDSTFDPTQSIYSYGGADWVNYREKYNILNVSLTSTASNAYTEAFKRVFDKIVTIYPAQHYGIKYSGHGVANGGMFENKVSDSDTKNLLSYFNARINDKIDFLDWNTNCNAGTYQILLNQYQYAKYIVASDLLRGGFNFDMNEYFHHYHEMKMHQFFTSSKTIKNSLVDMVNSERGFWASPITKNHMTTGRIIQSISIFDTEKFLALANSTNMGSSNYTGDALNYIRQYFPAQEAAFKDFRFHYINDKDFFSWSVDSNGFYLN